MASYRPSGEWSLRSVAIMVAIGVPMAVLCGLALGAISIRWLLALVVFLMVPGWVLGLSLVVGVHLGKLRNPWMAGSVGGAVALLMCGVWLARPAALPSMGMALGCLWVCLLPVFLPPYYVGEHAFCELDRRFMKRTTRWVPADRAVTAASALENGRLAELAVLTSETPFQRAGEGIITLVVSYCPVCLGGFADLSGPSTHAARELTRSEVEGLLRRTAAGAQELPEQARERLETLPRVVRTCRHVWTMPPKGRACTLCGKVEDAPLGCNVCFQIVCHDCLGLLDSTPGD